MERENNSFAECGRLVLVCDASTKGCQVKEDRIDIGEVTFRGASPLDVVRRTRLLSPAASAAASSAASAASTTAAPEAPATSLEAAAASAEVSTVHASAAVVPAVDVPAVISTIEIAVITAVDVAVISTVDVAVTSTVDVAVTSTVDVPVVAVDTLSSVDGSGSTLHPILHARGAHGSSIDGTGPACGADLTPLIREVAALAREIAALAVDLLSCDRRAVAH